MSTETTPKSREAEPLDFSKIEDLFEKLGRKGSVGFEVAGKELSDKTSIALLRHLKERPAGEDEITFKVQVLYGSMRKKSGRGILSFELTENGLDQILGPAVDLNREPFGFGVSIGEFHVGDMIIHGRKAQLLAQYHADPGRPYMPRRESNVRAGELMVNWLQDIIEADSFSEPPINLTLLDPKTIR